MKLMKLQKKVELLKQGKVDSKIISLLQLLSLSCHNQNFSHLFECVFTKAPSSTIHEQDFLPLVKIIKIQNKAPVAYNFRQFLEL